MTSHGLLLGGGPKYSDSYRRIPPPSRKSEVRDTSRKTEGNMEYKLIHPPYDNVRQAYQHLLKYNETPNIPRESPDAPVTLFVRNSFINYRPYESFEAISRFMNSNIFMNNVIVNLDHFKEKYRELQVRKMYRMITGERFDTDSGQDVFKVVWSLFNERKLIRMVAPKKGRHGNVYLFDLHKIEHTDVSFPRQCKVIIKALLAEQKSAYTVDELKYFANDLGKHGLKTKQPSFKILQYYLPQLFDAGLVEYPRKEYSNEGEE